MSFASPRGTSTSFGYDADRRGSMSRRNRMSRASKDEGIILSGDDLAEEEDKPKTDSNNLLISFVLMIFIGLGNKIFQKLQTIPMYNYPNFLNLWTTLVYIPASFAYIIPMAYYGYISKEQLDMPKKPFLIMGGLDAIAGIMQVFAATYLPGALIILLLQSAIPISMGISKYLLKATYNRWQYAGAVVVAIGIIVVLVPSMQGGEGGKTVLWSMVLILSAIPMTLSSVYKEIALGETELDPVFLNGWIAIFQFLLSIPLALPAAIAGDPAVYPDKLPDNLYNGMRCYGGINTIDDDDNGDDCAAAPLYVNLYLVFNISYNILIILILKYGSANVLWLAMTIMVPLGNIAFTLPFMPEHTDLRSTDIVGLVVIVGGLVCYRFAADLWAKYHPEEGPDSKRPLLDTVLEDGVDDASRPYSLDSNN